MSTPNFVELERAILRRWKTEDVFRKTLAKPAPRGNFVFYEGPPTANGLPHIGHVETRAFKDILPRFKTMQGYRVERKAGWDTQGLPVELEVEKAIGVSGKKDIEAYGVARFNEQSRLSVWKYKELWERMTERVGFWLDLEQPYVTYQPEYLETLWWIFKQAWDHQLLIQDYKVVPYCVRCGTTLSSHEVAQGYQRVTDRSVYLKFELADEPGTFILAWTTTPWTLPGNVALAVDPKISYFKSAPNEKGERFIVAEKRREKVLGLEATPHLRDKKTAASTFLGKALVGKKYVPLFDFLDLGKESGKQAYYIAAADFVTTEDGTGVVHTAVMYGEDDFRLGQQLDLPKRHTVNEDGTFNELVKPWQGKAVKNPKTEQAIVDWLKERGKLYTEEQYEHDYPFCWRCKSPLLYYAKTSWFLMMSKLRDRLLKNNEQIEWIPPHIQHGRFGEWLREVKDWAVSRERYWGTPLPIWICDHCGHRECLGSYQELLAKVKPRNRFFLVRHGEATISRSDLINTDLAKNGSVTLTAVGKKQATSARKKLPTKVDAVYSSEFLRTTQTAELIADSLKVEVKTDARLDEYQIGPQFEGKTTKEYHDHLPYASRFRTKPVGAKETWVDVRKRMMELLLELDAAHQGQTFVIVSHGDPLWLALWACSLKAEPQIGEIPYPNFAEPVELVLPSGLLQPDGSFDPHRPFIDGVTWACTTCDRGTMRRIPEVADAWFDSGSMPFAQWHYPFEHRDRIDGGSAFPAEYISEAIDQTRGWFYTLLAVGTLLEAAGAIPSGVTYRRCLVLGHIRDKDGKKLSKSLGNYLDPMELLEKHGADPVRFYLFTLNQPSEPKNFDEAGVGEVVKKTFMILWNVLSFWKLQALGVGPATTPPAGRHILDRWILAKTEAVTVEVTSRLERYEITEAGRALANFVTELSTWYIRRSRDRAKIGDRTIVASTLEFVLRRTAVLFAPFTPMLADALWRDLGGAASVHLEPWPSTGAIDKRLLDDMDQVRQVVEIGHALRAQAKLKVRQPLSQLVLEREIRPDLDEVLCQELNVKEVVTGRSLPTGKDWVISGGVALDTTVTDELREEGYVREMARAINALRKTLGLKPGEAVAMAFIADERGAKVVTHYQAALLERGSLSSLTSAPSLTEPTVTAALDQSTVTFGKA